MKSVTLLLACGLLAVSAFPAKDQVFSKWSPEGLRFSYLEDDEGRAHLVDNWLKMSDLERMQRYNPDRTNQYHLYTRNNEWISQPLVLNDIDRVLNSNFDPSKHTVVLMHGFLGSVTTGFNTVLVPAFLEAADCNVIILDWSSGAAWGPNADQAGQAAGRFITWLNSVTGAQPSNYHIVGYSVGGHGAAIIARNVAGTVGQVTGLDPAERWAASTLFSTNAATYTEVIHTSSLGETQTMAHVDFYPNGGQNMPGCITSTCDHYRSYYYMGESLRTGGFTGRRCATVQQATSQNCNEDGTLRMGGFEPKTGSTGIYHLRTNPIAPFSQG